jgi:hypothetical protein
VTAWLTHEDIEGWKCARRSGIEPTAADFDHALETIGQLQRQLVQQASRFADERSRMYDTITRRLPDAAGRGR